MQATPTANQLASATANVSASAQASATTQVLLSVQDVRVSYGGIQAVKGVSLEVRQGELVSLIGSNGAGKTTTMKAITGLLPLAGGQIQLKGHTIDGQGPWDLVQQGLAMVPEGRGVFTRMTILENLQMGAYLRSDAAQVKADIERVFDTFPRLKERRSQLAGTLSGGEQQMLAVGRALVLNPRVLLLDEPLEGLAPIIVEELLRAMARITREEGLSAIIVEQHPQAILNISHQAVVLDHGTVVHSGAAQDLLAQPALLDQLLGVARID